MGSYILKRLLLILPTILGILVINFVVVQFAPGGPIDQIVSQLTGQGESATARVSGGIDAAASTVAATSGTRYAGARGVDPELIEDLEKEFGFDKPVHVRFFTMVWNFVRFDFGESYFQDREVLDLIVERMPVSVSLGLWSTLLVYLISIPLGIIKAVRVDSRFDMWTSAVIFIGYAIPGFLFAVMLIVLFAGGNFWDLFPLRGLQSEVYSNVGFWGCATDFACVRDYFWHLTLPIVALTIGGFATLTMLTKNSFLEEVGKQYVLTARAKGCAESRTLYGHVFRNAMLIVIAGFPSAFIGILFTGSMLIEVIFSLDGLGLLGFEAIMKRDYPIIFGTLFCFTLLGLVLNLLSDLAYVMVDPRIDFESR